MRSKMLPVLNSPALLLVNINFEPTPAAQTLRELPEQNSSALQCQYRLPLLYLLNVKVLEQRVHPFWPRLCECGIIIHRSTWHSMSKKINITVSFCKQS